MKKKYDILLAVAIGAFMIGAGFLGVYYFSFHGINETDPYTDEDIANAISININERKNGTIHSFSNVTMYKYHHNNSAEKLTIWVTPYNISASMLGLNIIPNKKIQDGVVTYSGDSQTSYVKLTMNPHREGWLYFYVSWSILAENIRNTSYYVDYELFIHN
ncbi:MAG: hypothetical protein ACTSVL_03890 [Promethearchaeota archaeon]